MCRASAQSDDMLLCRVTPAAAHQRVLLLINCVFVLQHLLQLRLRCPTSVACC